MNSKTLKSSSDLFYKYLDTCKGEVKSRGIEGYYHVDIVADAYNQGFLDGKKLGKTEFLENLISTEIEKFTQKANQVYILSKNIISFLKQKKFNVVALYINLNPSRSSVIISIENHILNDDRFVEVAYSKTFENKKIFSKLFNEALDIGFLSSNNLDEKLLQEDGFGYIEKY